MINIAYSYVRISSKRQLDGDGIRRQTEKAQAYADANGLQLDTELQLQDVGSGYHGKHVKFGELGGFLKLVEAGGIPVGATLIVESLDRLSREDVLIAQARFIDILLAGITIVTLIDNQVYHKDRDFTQLIMSLSIMKRANDESETKRSRSKSRVRNNKLDALQGLPRFSISCPSWIDQTRTSGKDYTFSLNAHAETVRVIFQKYANGLGVHSIARYLNKEKFPVFKAGANKNGLWKDAAIRLILSNETAIGTYHVFETIDGKRVPMGEPIPNYYPAAVSEQLFWKAQRRRDEVSIRGAKGRKYTNLFAGFSYCAGCGSPLKLFQGGNGKKRNYITCKRRFIEGTEICNPTHPTFPYDALERAVLDNVTEFYADLDLNSSKTAKRAQLTQAIAQIEPEIADAEKRRANLLAMSEMAEHAEERADFINRIQSARAKIEDAKARLAEYRKNLREIVNETTERMSAAEMISLERLRWTTANDDEVKESRARVSQAMRKFITMIKVYLSDQAFIVEIAGGARGYAFDREGNLFDVLDNTDLPFEQFAEGMKIDGMTGEAIAQAKKAYALIKAH